jgi:ribosome-binding factor A
MAKSQRMRRIADQIQRELGTLIAGELSDPRFALVTISGVDVSPDLAHATVYYTSLADQIAAPAATEPAAGVAAAPARPGRGAPPLDRAQTARALHLAAGMMRSALACRLGLRVVPDLRFEYDHSLERGLRVDRLIDQALKDSS